MRSEARKTSDALYRRNHPESVKAARTRWRQAHQDQIRQYNADYVPPRKYESQPVWASTHSAQKRLNWHKRQALKLHNGVSRVTDHDWTRLLVRYRNECAYCGRKDRLQQEHVIPLARGGRHSIGNLLPVCGSCNASKHDKLLVEWKRHSKETAA